MCTKESFRMNTFMGMGTLNMRTEQCMKGSFIKERNTERGKRAGLMELPTKGSTSEGRSTAKEGSLGRMEQFTKESFKMT